MSTDAYLFRRLTLAILPCLFVAIGCNSPQVWVEAERHLELDATEIQQLAIENDNGSILVRGIDSSLNDNKIYVDVRVRAGGKDQVEAEACLGAIEIEAAPVTRKIQLVRTNWLRSKRPDWGQRLSYSVRLPKTMAVQAQTDNGRITVEDTEGPIVLDSGNGALIIRGGAREVRAHSGNGRIVVQTAAPDIDLDTGNGGIQADLSASGPVAGRIDTGNGSVRVSFTPDTFADLTVNTGNGRIRARSLNIKDLYTTRNSLRGTIGEGGGTLRIRTGNGSVTLE